MILRNSRIVIYQKSFSRNNSVVDSEREARLSYAVERASWFLAQSFFHRMPTPQSRIKHVGIQYLGIRIVGIQHLANQRVFIIFQKREKKRHESTLIDEYLSSINFLNQFLPPDAAIQYIGFDMARINKR